MAVEKKSFKGLSEELSEMIIALSEEKINTSNANGMLKDFEALRVAFELRKGIVEAKSKVFFVDEENRKVAFAFVAVGVEDSENFFDRMMEKDVMCERVDWNEK